jgi:NADH-quinone oxidoreductase subunit H
MGSVVFMMFIRWTVPRIRYDQVLKLCWQVLIPLSIVILVATSVMVYFGMTSTLPMLGMNILLLVGVLAIAPVVFNRADVNTRIPMAGSRFSPLPGASVATAPTDPTALDDNNPFRAVGSAT